MEDKPPYVFAERTTKVTRYVGLKLDMDENFFEQSKEQAIKVNAEHYIDIELTYQGRTIELTREEFVRRVFMEPPGTP